MSGCTGVCAGVDLSVVVIGRNEGERLMACLHSVRAAQWGTLQYELIYVDSDSTDGSPARAAGLGARVLDLGGRRPSAAAARNVGWRAACAPVLLFLDGDTELQPQFVLEALPHLAAPGVAGVWGHRRESRPSQSIYTRVLDLDWIFATGRVPYFGGDVLVRREALEQSGGFDDALVAGEEPELCRRLRAQGWSIEHIDAPMTTHDLAITTLRAWWRRGERAGLAYAQVAARYAHSEDPFWLAEARANRLRGAFWLLLPVLLTLLLLATPGLAAVCGAAVMALLLRSAWRCRWKCPGRPLLALVYALHSQLQQVPILFGQWRWMRLAGTRRRPTLIEYKSGPPQAPGVRRR